MQQNPVTPSRKDISRWTEIDLPDNMLAFYSRFNTQLAVYVSTLYADTAPLRDKCLDEPGCNYEHMRWYLSEPIIAVKLSLANENRRPGHSYETYLDICFEQFDSCVGLKTENNKFYLTAGPISQELTREAQMRVGHKTMR